MIISLYSFDHGIRHADGGCDEAWNLTPALIAAHREKTAAIDVPQMAKSKRIRETQASHGAKMSVKSGDTSVTYPTLGSRPKRKIPSRPFDSRHKPLRWFTKR